MAPAYCSSFMAMYLWLELVRMSLISVPFGNAMCGDAMDHVGPPMADLLTASHDSPEGALVRVVAGCTNVLVRC